MVIPDTVSYEGVVYIVSSIGVSAFQQCDNLDTVVLGDNIQSIGDYAFNGCTSLSYLVLGHSIDSIGKCAFNGTSLRYLYFDCPDVTIPGLGIFNTQGEPIYGRALSPYSYNPSNMALTDPFYSIRTQTSLTIEFGPHITSIPQWILRREGSYLAPYRFEESICLADSIILGPNIRKIDDYQFSGMRLSAIIVPEILDSVGNHAFDGCSRLVLPCIPDSLSFLGEYAFHSCTNLQGTINIPFGINNIKRNTFSNCPQITSIILHNNITSVGDYAFANCTNVSSIYIGTGIDSIGKYAFLNCRGEGILQMPDNVKYLGRGSFYGCSGFDTIYLSNHLKYIGESSFANLTNIFNLILDSTYYIGDSAFNNCSNIHILSYGDKLVTVGSHTFENCIAIDSIYIGCYVNTIGQSAFSGCNFIRALHYNAKNCSTPICFQSNPIVNSISTLTFGDSVRTIPEYSFANCDSLATISINARTIGQSAFADCDRLSQVVFGDGVQTIGDSAFFNCNNLLTVSTNAQNIGSNAFADCDRLVSVTLGDSVQTLGSGTFSGCFRLNNVSLGEGITSIGDSAFGGCIRLTKPELPNSLATIGARAFDGCGDINGKLTFPASITHIGDYAYNGVGNIMEIEMKGSTPPTIHAHTFAAVDSLVTVSVPCGAVLNYYITDYWENFPNIVEAPPYRLTVQSNNEVMGFATVTQQTTCSNHTATIYAVAQTGYHFLQWNDGFTANPRSIPMTQDSAFTAIFVVNNSYITVHANDSTMGSVSGSGLYGYNAPVTLTATPYSGYHFLRWSDGNTQNPRYLAAVRDSSFTAIFVSNVSTITVANANPDMGNVSGSGVYYYQNLVSLTATANYGYHFVQWNDGNTQNPRTIIVRPDSAFTAFFALNTYSIVATSNSTTMGSVSGGGQYTYLHEMSMTATPAYGYHFVQWNDGVTDNPRTITVTRDSAFTAQFAANSYTLTVAPNDATMGSAYGAGNYNYNTTATLTAVPNYGYHFTQWSDAVTDNPRIVTVLNNATYTAQFEINSYIITVQSSNPAIGTTSGSGSYNYLTPVNITALPNAGYHFTQWSDGNMTNPRLISVTANATYTAQFAINSYAVGVTSNNSTMGSVSGSGTYNHNSTATLTATPYYGYHFVQRQDGNTQNPRTVTVTDSAQYTAQFDYNSYLVTALSSNVTLGTAIGGGSYNYLSQVALTAVPAPHYHFTMWNDSIEDNPRT
ncbi:MAG: leucine-rich repeat protein, partial [Bacteroidales bacterium]|nr:leucine-rich repeat protein [Bacteroidales bacterium]